MIKRIISTKTGMFIRDDFTASKGEIALDVAPAQGFYWPKWDGKQWVEGRTQAEIDAIKAQAEQSVPDIVTVMAAEIVSLKERLAKIESTNTVKAELVAISEPIIKEPIISK